MARFGLLALDRLEAVLEASREAGGVAVSGRVMAEGTQPCVLSGEPVAFAIDEPVALRFVEHATPAGDEIELGEADLDTLPIEGDAVDLGEAAAQTFGLALDPYPRAQGAAVAEARRLLVSEEEAAARAEVEHAAASPFAAIKRG